MIKVLYAPFGLVASVLGGVLAGALFKRMWALIGDENDAPDSKDRDTTWTEVLTSAAVQGAVFGTVKALIDRAGAKGFEHATGAWPGNTDPRHSS